MGYEATPGYLDNAASTATDPRVLEAMLPFLGAECANPSSVHGPGVRARAAVERARELLMEGVTRKPRRVVFTSGGSEANNLGIGGFARLRRGPVVCSEVEHPSAWRAAEQAAAELEVPLERVRVDADGRIDLDHLDSLLSPRTGLVALIHGQNETGVLQPIAAAAERVRRKAPRALIHVDAVQSFGQGRNFDPRICDRERERRLHHLGATGQRYDHSHAYIRLWLAGSNRQPTNHDVHT